MKIKKVSTDRFAGICDKEIKFNDGINVILGDNESGKSTIVNLISEIPFQNSKVGEKVKSDILFKKTFFSAERTDGKESGKNIDGVIEIETPAGDYKFKKEWGAEPSAKLITPEKTVKNMRIS